MATPTITIKKSAHRRVFLLARRGYRPRTPAGRAGVAGGAGDAGGAAAVAVAARVVAIEVGVGAAGNYSILNKSAAYDDISFASSWGLVSKVMSGVVRIR